MTNEVRSHLGRFPAIVANLVFSLVLATILLISIVVGVRLKHWPFIENLVGETPFGDLGVLLAMADFLRSNPDGNAYANMLNYGYVPNYPLLLPTLLGPTGLGHADVLSVGIAIAAAVTFALVGLLSWALVAPSVEKILERGAVLIIAFVSPPTMLLLERGNYDSIVFLLIVMACAIAIKSRFVAAGVIWFAALIKLFPIGAMLAIVRRGRGLILPLGLSAVFAIYGISILDELTNISANTPRPHWLGFGWQVFAGYCEEFFPGQSKFTYLFFTLALNFAAAALGFWFFRVNSIKIDELVSKVRDDKLSEMLFLTGTFTLLAAFAIGNAFDYRLVFLLLPLVAIVRNEGLTQSPGRLIVIGITGTLFWSLATYQLQPFGDVLVTMIFTILGIMAAKIIATHFPRSTARTAGK